MSINPKQCPYLVEAQAVKITCRGLSSACTIRQHFTYSKDRAAHYTQYCAGDYHLCSVAAELNAFYHEYDDSPCPYNEGVSCFFKKGCDKCGWNLEVSLERLKQRFPMCSPECLEMLLTRNEELKCLMGGSNVND